MIEIPSTTVDGVRVRELKGQIGKKKLWKESLNTRKDYGKWMRQAY
jgi:hypothetical protein